MWPFTYKAKMFDITALIEDLRYLIQKHAELAHEQALHAHDIRVKAANDHKR